METTSLVSTLHVEEMREKNLERLMISNFLYIEFF